MSRDDKGAPGGTQPVGFEPRAADGDHGAGPPSWPPRRLLRSTSSELVADPELARYRSWLDQQLARRSHAQSLTRSRPAVPDECAHLALSWLPSALREKPRWLIVVPIIAVLAIGGMAWWMLRKPPSAFAGTSVSTPPSSEAPGLVDQALQQELGKIEQGHEIIALREALKQAEQRGVVYRQERLAAGKAGQEREVGSLRQTPMQVEQQLAERGQLLAQECNRLEAEIVTRRRTVAMAVEPGVEGAHLRSGVGNE